jgi:hypothetical protein
MIDSNNFAAYEAGLSIEDCNEDSAFAAYREAVSRNEFQPGVAASVCFVAGYLGRDFPSHDNRIYS